MDRFKKIMVPVDGKRGTYECVRLACHIGKQNNSDIFLVYAINLSNINTVARFYNDQGEKIINENIKVAEACFHRFISNIKLESTYDFKFTTRVVKGKNVDELLIDFAQNNMIDLIIMSLTPKKSALDIVMGNILLRVVEFSKVPVLVLPAVADTEETK